MVQVESNVQKSSNFSIGFVNYKTLELTRSCLTLLKKHFDNGLLDFNRVHVWVVDNDSQDASTSYLRSLDWIHLIERVPESQEKGFVAHGKALNLILEKAQDDYLFIMHSDTFIYEPQIFEQFLQECNQHTIAVGCLEQLNRGFLRSHWRIFTRFMKHYSRRARQSIGLESREPKPWREQYIKSYFALWNIKWIKQQGYSFFNTCRIPTYELQDHLQQDQKIRLIPPKNLFQFLDHVQAGTVGLVADYNVYNRRVKRKMKLLKKLGQSQNNHLFRA